MGNEVGFVSLCVHASLFTSSIICIYSSFAHLNSSTCTIVANMNRRESTNVKLAAIINSKDNDQEEEAAVINEEQKAKQRLRRSSLYGGGARYVIA